MSMTAFPRDRATHQLFVLAIVITAILLTASLVETVWAQGSPFGGPRPAGASQSVPADGIIGWLFAKQAQFYRQFSGLIRSAKADGRAVWSLFGVSFLYGVFHAAGPGHGKAVISSYLVANEETWIRGVVLSLASALLQAAVAVAVVGVAAALLNVSAPTMNGAVNMIESASYALIILVGARLLWVKGRGFVSGLRTTRRPVSEVGAAAVTVDHDSDVGGHGLHSHGDHTQQCSDHHHSADHGHDHSHGENRSSCGHVHAPEPSELSGADGWKRGLTTIVAIGLRPCSGAILVLVFALAQGLFWVGAGSAFVMGLGTFATVATVATITVLARDAAGRLASARPGYGVLAMRGVEVAAAALITAFGVFLLCGYLVNERMIGL
jgi:nickel/cobalt transporter (NicO) family protein